VGRVALLALLGCAGPEWRNADLQIDISGRSISDEARVRICVEGAGQREQAVGADSVSFPGLPSDGELRVWVDLLDGAQRAARAGPTLLGVEADYARLVWKTCTADCAPCADGGLGAASGADSRLLAVRFLD
jgi:hypothetical protein